MTLLLVDDRALNLKLLRVILQAEGHQTKEASDGLEALERLRTAEFDAVISDILMPNMDGYRLCRAIREDPRWNHVALVIYTSTYVSQGDKELALRSGADAYLSKPAPANELLAVIGDAISRRRRGVVSGSVAMEEVFLREYNEALVRKLEERNIDLEEKTRLLVDSEQKFRTLVENLRLTFFLAGPEGRPIHYVSPAYESMWERTCESLYRDPDSWMESIVPEDLERVRRATDPRPTSFDLEFRIRIKSGAVRWIRLRSMPAFDSHGGLKGVCGLAEDITQLKEAEFQLLQAHKMESVGLLAGGVAHDFNNILTAIAGFNTLSARRDTNPENGHRYSLMIEKLVGRGAKLTRQLLAFARQQPIDPRIVDLSVVLDEFVRLVAPAMGDDIELVVDKEASEHRVRIDPGQIEQVLMNLCLNARDAMPSGGTLTLRLRIADDRDRTHPSPPRWVELSVGDSGSGMSPDVMQRIFEPFFTTKGVGKGTGLGLAASYGIITQSGGFLRVDSQLGVGSVFTIQLPEDSHPVVAALEPTRRMVGKKQTTTILVVDDDADVADATEAILRDHGFQTLLSNSGKDALRIVADDRLKAIRLILSDLVMPQMDGVQLSLEVAKLRPDIRFLFVSGYASDSIISRGINVDEHDILHKPFSLDELLTKINEHVDAGNST